MNKHDEQLVNFWIGKQACYARMSHMQTERDNNKIDTK